ncbi:hypothetical protein OTB20_40085 [Streptomyces sp. H27-H1]|uniref:hypothetical protein n=1 Tax=Streptomyces sp. H27-H1 TaxID=2996461 RepID=UPI0022718D08|nr:hypothetical protein [Streptomyces sp. H27-H1]MCY0932254.1 hypothetical protein [Streptomyces sp. H27-H1]
MSEKKPRKPTPPSEAPGESGDREARQEAEEAVISGSHADVAGDARTPGTDAGRRADKRETNQSP